MDLTPTPFRISPSTCFRIECGSWLSRLAAVWAIVLVTTVIASMADLRYGLVGLILLMLVFPFAAFHVYFSRLLNIKARVLLALKRVSVESDNSIKVEYLESDSDPHEPPAVKYTEIYRFEEISRVIRHGAYLAVSFTDNGTPPLIIPVAVLSVDDLDTLTDLDMVGKQ